MQEFYITFLRHEKIDSSLFKNKIKIEIVIIIIKEKKKKERQHQSS